jgi:hypothetical protein
MTVAGGGLAAAVAVAVAVAVNPGAVNGALEQDQPAHQPPGTTDSSTPAPQASPSTATTGIAAIPTGPQQGPASTPAARASDSGTTTVQPAAPQTAAADSSPVRRDRTMLGNEVCRQPLSGWGTTGWCFVAADIVQFTAGHTTTLSVSLCHNGSDAGQVRFPSRQQASWDVAQGHTHYWTSSEQPSPFAAGEVVTLQPKECLRWRVDWHVTTHGRPMPTGDYFMQWNTGADLRDPSGTGYHDATNIHVGPAGQSNGLGPLPRR